MCERRPRGEVIIGGKSDDAPPSPQTPGLAELSIVGPPVIGASRSNTSSRRPGGTKHSAASPRSGCSGRKDFLCELRKQKSNTSLLDMSLSLPMAQS
jgi:hypothetical protein